MTASEEKIGRFAYGKNKLFCATKTTRTTTLNNVRANKNIGGQFAY